MDLASVTVSDIIDVLNLPSTRRTNETNHQLPVQPASDAILVEKASNDSEDSIITQSFGTIPGNELKSGGHNTQRLCHRLCYHQSKDVSKENPVSFLSQKRFYVASLGRAVTLDDFRRRSCDFEGKSLEKEKRSWRAPEEWHGPSDDSSLESSSGLIGNSFDSDPSQFFRRWKSFVNDMGTILSTQGRTSLHDWDQNEKTSAEDLDDSMDWLRRPPIRNRFDTGNRGIGNRTTENGDTLPSRVARSSDLDRVGLRSGNGVSSSIRRPRKYFLGDEEDDIDLPRRERINFKLLAAQLFRPKRAMVSIAPKTSDPNVYAFSSPLSEELACLDLIALSRDRRDWRTVTEARPKDPMEERILDRLLHIKRLEDETVEMENAERSSRGSQCRAYEQQPRQTRTSASGGKDCGSAGRSDVRVARALETKVYRLSMERSGLEKPTRLRKMELKDDPTGKLQPQKRCTSRKPQLERPNDTSEQSVSRLILASSIQPGCEKLVQVKGHQLTSDDPDDMKTKLEGSSSLKLRAGHRKLGNGRSATADSVKAHPSLRTVSFADPPKMPRSTKQKTSYSTAAYPASATAKPSSSKKRMSSKKRPRTAV